MPVREKKQCEVCGARVFKLAKHLRTQHLHMTDDAIDRIIVGQRKARATNDAHKSYYRCPVIHNYKKCDSIIKENG